MHAIKGVRTLEPDRDPVTDSLENRCHDPTGAIGSSSCVCVYVCVCAWPNVICVIRR